jgi:excisionase family DNA binding protein
MAQEKKPYLTTREISEICDVSIVTVGNWIRSGKLAAYRPPAGRYRIRPGDLFSFLSQGGMPIPPGLEPSETGRRILVVDDEPSFERFVRSALHSRLSQCTVDGASNGFDAGRRIAEHKPDLVILDLRMPGLDGFAVCAQLKQSPRYSDVRVLVVSGYLDDDAKSRAEEAGADMCMPKPIAPDDLLDAVEDLLPVQTV